MNARHAAIALSCLTLAACATNQPNETADSGGSSYPRADASYSDRSASDSSSWGGPFDASAASDAPSAAPPNPIPTRPGDDAGPDADASVTTCDLIPSHDPVTLYLSADDSNSNASPVIARRMIRRGERVPLHILRTYEFLNYYNVPYAAAAAGHVALDAQMHPGTEPGAVAMQVGITSEARTPQQVRPMTITFVLDTSGSMGSDGRIERERAVVRAIARHLRAGDIVSAVTWSTDQRVALSGHVVTGPDDPAIVGLATSLSASGGTDLEGGLVAGYDLARANYGAGRLNRVVVISDGEANVGVTSADLIAQNSHRAEEEEIYLVGVGVGDGFNDTMMDTVTDRGRGAYLFIDSDAEADRMFGPRFEENMDLAVRAVRLEITLPWYMQVIEFHGEQISTDPRQVDPQHLAPNDSMVFHQIVRACGPSVIDTQDPVRIRATYEDRDTRVAGEETIDTTLGEVMGNAGDPIRRGDAIVAYAEALKKVETDGAAAGITALEDAQTSIRAIPGYASDADLTEIDSLITAYLATLRP